MSKKKTGSSSTQGIVSLSKSFAIVMGAVTVAGITGFAAIGSAMIVVISLMSFVK